MESLFRVFARRQAFPHENLLDQLAAPLHAALPDEPVGAVAPRWRAFVNLVAGCIPRCQSGELNPITTGQALRDLSQRYFVGVSGRSNPEIERTDHELDASQQQIDTVLLAFWNDTKRCAVVNNSARAADKKTPVWANPLAIGPIGQILPKEKIRKPYSFQQEVAADYAKNNPPPQLAKNLTPAERRALARGKLHVDE
jgi:hypothetical protein